MHEVCGCGVPGLGLSGAENSLQHGQDSASLCDGNGLGFAPDHWLGSGARGHPGGGRTQTVIHGESEEKD